jgi:hypothetical protein
MTYERLGLGDQAKATLDRLRESMKDPYWSGAKLYQSMLREAEAQIEGTSSEPR